MLSHVTVGSNDVQRAERFYDSVLAPLGFSQRTMTADGGPAARCWAPADRSRPWFFVYAPFDGQPATPANGGMTAFMAPSREAVVAAYETALAAGGRDEGPPALRPHYAPDYFGAYVRDLDGNKIHFVSRAS